MDTQTQNPIFCALDMTDPDATLALARRLAPHVGGFKLGLESFVANGPEVVSSIVALGQPVFLDLKLHDIPNTVAGAVRSAARLGVQYLTLHAAGGSTMMRAAIDTAKACDSPPKLLAVTVLTSMSDEDLAECGIDSVAEHQVLRLANLAANAGIDGLVCSPQEIVAVKSQLGDRLELVIPGIRPTHAAKGDQKRTLSPSQAIHAGADWLVIGRPITEASDPAAAAAAIALEVAGK